MFHVWWLWYHCTITSRLNAVGKKYLRQKSLPWRQNSVSEEKKSTNDSLLNTVPTAPNTFILKLFRWRLKNNQCVSIQTKSRQMTNCHLYSELFCPDSWSSRHWPNCHCILWREHWGALHTLDTRPSQAQDWFPQVSFFCKFCNVR